MPELIGFAGTVRRQSSTPLRPTAGDWPADVLDMEKHLLEVFRGVPMEPNTIAARPGYDLTQTTQEQRITAKVAELAGTSLARSRQALFYGRLAGARPSEVLALNEPGPVMEAVEIEVAG